SAVGIPSIFAALQPLLVTLDICSSAAMCCFGSFFFSSRRRHTRCYRDWSSDVCSSDLRDRQATPGRRRQQPCGAVSRTGCRESRSEERRVGKECRSRWGRYNEKKRKEEGKELQEDEKGEATKIRGRSEDRRTGTSSN